MREFRDFLRLLLLSWTGSIGIGSEAFVMIPKPSFGRISSSSLLFSTGTKDDSGIEESGGGRVNVEVCKSISFPPDSLGEDPLAEASNRVRDAWMKHHWKKGGGLPIVIIEKENESNIDNIYGRKRVIAPVMMEETISSFQADSASCIELEYKVTSPGPFFGPDLVEGSHIGRVTFSSSNVDSGGNAAEATVVTTMVWRVEFDAIRLLDLYQKVTEFTIGTAATTVQEASSTPRLLTISTQVPMAAECESSSQACRREWLDFLFSTTGGGLPIIPPPIPFGDILPEGGGIARKKLYRFPFVVETAMVQGPAETVEGTTTATACYRLENPGWWTFPFLYHTHLGRVAFQQSAIDGEAVDMIWEVEIRPYSFCAPLVEQMTTVVVTTIARNFRTQLEFPGAKVELGWLSVPMGTWMGRVLEARTRDERSFWEQAASLLQPWGDSRNDRRAEDEVVFEWSDGGLE